MILILINEDGAKKIYDESAPLRFVIDYIAKNNIETIVVGETRQGRVEWEKQFRAVTVMPSQFGKK